MLNFRKMEKSTIFAPQIMFFRVICIVGNVSVHNTILHPHMNKFPYYIFAVVLSICAFFSSCKDDVTYAEMRKSEIKSVKAFIKKGCHVTAEDGKTVLLHVDPIKEISEEEFFANDSTTDVSKNEYVLFSGSGVYMQIIRKGQGEKIKEGETTKVLCRYHEFNLSTDSLQSSNRVVSQEQLVDIMNVTNVSGTYTAAFSQGLMYNLYGSAVPGGWVMALPFVKLGRKDDDIAKIRLIVPSDEGQAMAKQGIYACFYEISMQRGR